MLAIAFIMWIKTRHRELFNSSVALTLTFFMGTQALALSEMNRTPAALRAAEGLTAPSKILKGGEAPLSPDLIYNYEQVKNSREVLKPQDYIPLNMKPTDDSSQVISEIADKSVGKILNDPEIRASALGRTATKVEKSMKQEVVLGGGKSGPNQVEHKINFQILAFQTRAEMKYEGLTNAVVSYEARNSTTTFEIFENLPTAQHQQLVLSHELRPDERVSNLSLRWNW